MGYVIGCCSIAVAEPIDHTISGTVSGVIFPTIGSFSPTGGTPFTDEPFDFTLPMDTSPVFLLAVRHGDSETRVFGGLNFFVDMPLVTIQPGLERL
jgi:hypothetical protein